MEGNPRTTNRPREPQQVFPAAYRHRQWPAGCRRRWCGGRADGAFAPPGLRRSVIGTTIRKVHRAEGGTGLGPVISVIKRSPVSTGQLRRFRALHLRPINLVVFQGALVARRQHGILILGWASRLDAFSGYPFPTWLSSRAASATTGTPEVGPSQSSRTKEESPQDSCAHGR